MADTTLDQVAEIQEGGVWTSTNLLGEETWTGEAATTSSNEPREHTTITPKTPAQEDKELLVSVLKNPDFISALLRELERTMLKQSGRSPHTSLLQQVTNEREEAVQRVREWVAATQQTHSVSEHEDSKETQAKMKSLEEKIISLELKIEELMTTAVTQKSQEKEMIDEAYKILQERRREDIGSERTPSEVTRMEQRTIELDRQIARMQEITPTMSTSPKTVAAKNKKKFGSLFN